MLATFTVDTAADVVNAGDGVTSLREAIQQANADTVADDIVFDASLNGQTITLGLGELTVTEALTITGPGSGLLTIDANDASRIFNLDGDAAAHINVSISGLTLTNGFVELVGGGAIMSNVNLTLDDLIVTNSMSGDADSFTSGGGLFQFSPGGPGITTDANVRTLTITDSVFQNNNARGRGGAMYLFSQIDATITDSEISGNTSWFEGGAIYTFFEESPEFLNPPDWRDLTLDVVSTTIDGNMSLSNQGRGGALHNDGSIVTFLNSTISNNFGRVSGGAFFSRAIVGNTVTSFPRTNVINSTVTGNSTNGDGGVKQGTAGYLFINSTLVLNRADADGNGSGEGGGLHGSAEAHNTIIAGNVAGGGAGTPSDVSSGGTLFNSTFNLIGDAGSAGGLTDGADGNIVGNGGAGTITLNTILDLNLADNGGPTLTHVLVSGSPALSAGSNAEAVDDEGVALTTDQRGTGFPRIVSGTVDIGAIEGFVTPPPMPMPGPPDIIGQASSGTIVVLHSTGMSFASHVYGGADPADWQEIVYGDFNGDGLTDAASLGPGNVIGVLLNDGNSFSTTSFQSAGNADPTKVFVGLFTGHFNNDGNADLYLLAADGTWTVALSQAGGTSFTTIPVGAWPAGTNFMDAQTGDFNNDGLTDVFGHNADGELVVGLATPGMSPQLTFSTFGRWSTNVTWQNVQTADVNGDGRSDLLARASTGTWVVGLSSGTSFALASWGGWTTLVTWDGVQTGDFNDDGRADLVGRASNGRIVVGLSTGSQFTFTSWGVVSTNVTWPQIVVGDFNFDGRSDLALRASTGTWVVGISSGTQLTLSAWGGWSTAVTWDHVATGDFVLV